MEPVSVATTVKLKKPPAVGMPLSVPLLEIVRPVGNTPLLTAKL